MIDGPLDPAMLRRCQRDVASRGKRARAELAVMRRRSGLKVVHLVGQLAHPKHLS